MKKLLPLKYSILSFAMLALLNSCASTLEPESNNNDYQSAYDGRFETDYSAFLPQYMKTKGKMILIDPNVHAWGAYDTEGNLIRAGIATSGGEVCPPDAEGESNCRTASGTFYINTIRGEDCASKKYPRPNGGGLMPYCMFFHGGQALHGSPDDIVVNDNISHGCVRIRIPDAQWIVTNFAQVGTKVVVRPY